MRVSPSAVALSVIAISVLLACAVSWIVALVKAAITRRCLPEPIVNAAERLLVANGLSPRLPLVSWSPRRAVPWGFIEILVTMALLALLSFASATAEETDESVASNPYGAVLTGILASLFITALLVAVVAVRSGATIRDFGWSAQEVLSDLRLGVIGFVMVGPPVYALQGILVTWWQESKHPLIELFRTRPEPSLFALVFVSAVVVAPIAEELIFRVILQGFLEKAATLQFGVQDLLFGSARIFIGESILPHETTAATEADRLMMELRGVWAWLPIVISSLIFALLHYFHGPDWVPLILLAMGKGYLYQRTHRIVPSIVVHTLLNGFSMWFLWVGVQEGFKS